LTPIFILCLFYDHPWSNIWALIVFVIAGITDAYDGYYARKYDLVTPEGKFLDPLADKILVSSAFISFAIIGVIDYWMVALIIFRDLFITGLRMVMNFKGLEMVTSNIAKAKTVIQINIILFILIILGIKGLSFSWAFTILKVVRDYHLIYNFTLIVTIITVLTGFGYIYSNRNTIIGFLKNE
tara:strand:- start:203 stop:751 length:549 start_codon:yes stop_codon:yes gene_type:complete